MIARLIGRLVEVTDGAALLDINGVVYEAFVPAYLIARLRGLMESGSREVTLHTLHFIEGGIGGSQMTPRLIGFLDRADRDFFQVFTTVKGIGTRKALKSMIEEPAELAGYIEAGNKAALTRLPEIGGRTAEKIIAELRGKLARFALEAHAAQAEPDYKLEALRVLVETIQYSRAEAEDLIERALERNSKINTVDDLIQEALNPERG
jgi:Holliday junction DNA helicase RuvA